jgi:tryptophan-rich sensory protein
MNIMSIILIFIFLVLIIAALYTIIKYPKDILKGFLFFIKPDYRPLTWILSPIWLFFYLLDKLFKLNIID